MPSGALFADQGAMKRVEVGGETLAALDRRPVDGLPHPRAAQGLRHAAGFVVAQTSFIPRKVEEIDESPCLTLLIGDDRFVVQLKEPEFQHAAPVFQDALVLAVSSAEMSDIARVEMVGGGKRFQEAGNARVRGIAATVDHARRGEDGGEEARVFVVEQMLVEAIQSRAVLPLAAPHRFQSPVAGGVTIASFPTRSIGDQPLTQRAGGR
jgi:hypothetical protein